jgi:uncharacterized protein
LTKLPEKALKDGARPYWIGYVEVDNVDATVKRIKEFGGAVHIPPTDLPDISRFSVVTDPQMAALALIKGFKRRQGRIAEVDHPGRVGWHELLAADWEKAFSFYGELFGWQKADSHVGSVGIYQQFSAGGETRRQPPCPSSSTHTRRIGHEIRPRLFLPFHCKEMQRSI